MPIASDVTEVMSVLAKHGLPWELQLDIMELADYTPKRRLYVPHDPFHPGYREVLRKYLAYCWKLLLHSDMMVKALNEEMSWKSIIAKCILELWEPHEEWCLRGKQRRYMKRFTVTRIQVLSRMPGCGMMQQGFALFDVVDS
jgi:hypothetical protein